LSVGRFVNEKNYITALKAIKHLGNLIENIDFEYKIIGHGPLKNHIEKWIKQMDISNYVILQDFTNSIFEEYCNADIYLSTSLYEGLSNSIMEASLSGLPIVATNVGDNKYIVKHNINGYLCLVGDYKQIAKYLYLLLSDRNLRKKMALEGIKNIKTNFGREKFTNSYLKLIKQL
jgi:glycosyltransferase involved in cell wall biosynthesis